jgi:hypothetical protein
MSNKYQANPLSFTSAGASLKSFLGPKYFPVSSNGRFRVKRVVWVNPAANGDTFSVTDNGATPNVLASGVAVTASIGLSQTIPVDQLVEDVVVAQISSGTVQIYIEQE